MEKFKAVIFDLDGTLLVSNIDFQAIRDRIGVPPGESILDFLNRQKPEVRDRGHAILHALEAEAAASSLLLPGVKQTIAWLQESAVPFGVLTRNTRRTWETVRSRHPTLNPDLVVTRDCAPPKPDAESVLPFVKKWGIEPARFVHVGDYLYDLELASAVGMHSILLNPSGENPFEVECDRVVRDHEELVDYLGTILEKASG